MSNRFVVRYGVMCSLGEFAAKGGSTFPRAAPVIVRSERGVEWGEVLCSATERTHEYLKSGDERGNILRTATEDDYRKLDEIHAQEQIEFQEGLTMIRERHLAMQLVDLEHLFGDDRLIFHYLAEKRVDFRELVKALAKRFQTRIEMRQIGIRDEAKLLADYGDCGKPVCCNTHLQEMPPVSMKMAKLQKASLDPTKISGRCGRLKCCLRYEYDTYEEYRRELPPTGAMVITKAGQGKVLAQEILAKKLIVQYEDGRQLLTALDEVLTVISRQKRGDSDPAPAEDAG